MSGPNFQEGERNPAICPEEKAKHVGEALLIEERVTTLVRNHVDICLISIMSNAHPDI